MSRERERERERYAHDEWMNMREGRKALMAACRAQDSTLSSKKSPLVRNHPFQTPGYICPFPVPFLPSLQSHLHSLPYKQAYGQASLSLSLSLSLSATTTTTHPTTYARIQLRASSPLAFFPPSAAARSRTPRAKPATHVCSLRCTQQNTTKDELTSSYDSSSAPSHAQQR